MIHVISNKNSRFIKSAMERVSLHSKPCIYVLFHFSYILFQWFSLNSTCQNFNRSCTPNLHSEADESKFKCVICATRNGGRKNIFCDIFVGFYIFLNIVHATQTILAYIVVHYGITLPSLLNANTGHVRIVFPLWDFRLHLLVRLSHLVSPHFSRCLRTIHCAVTVVRFSPFISFGSADGLSSPSESESVSTCF
jgi:hypothetical protein